MTATTISKALGQLQNDPENDNAWSELESGLTANGGGAPDAPMQKLLAAARQAHASRRESEAVARLLEIEADLVKGTKGEAALVRELAGVVDNELFDEQRATIALLRLRKLEPNDASVTKTMADREAARTTWATTAEKILEESKGAAAASFTSALLVSAAETMWRYGRAESAGTSKAAKKKLGILLAEIEQHLQRAVELDRTNRRAAHLLERVLLSKGDLTAVAALIKSVASELPREERVPELLRLARLYRQRLNEPEKAATAYAEVLDLTPGHPEATGALVDHFTTTEKWDELGNLYEEQLLTVDEPDPGMVLQVAMVNWKMRNKPDAAEPFFERVRRNDPGHPMAVEFFRSWTKERGDIARLTQILQDAQKVAKDAAQKTAYQEEIARLADEGASASKAIDQWRFVLRQDPTNREARDGLKRLYRQTAAWNALADLLRSELERIPQDDARERLPVLREIATVYRDQIKSDSALVSVLSQMVQLAPDDDVPLRELARVHEQLGRWRDLLSVQTRLAELEPRAAAKAELYRAVARRWLDQFSNVQNAAEAYEKLLEIAPADEDAGEKLRELYAKRRAYRPLYDLLQKQSDQLQPGKPRRELWMEMARIASERLERGGEAVYLYKRVLEEDGANTGALDALEKQAERDRDYATVADVLERRTRIGENDAEHDAEWTGAQMIVLQRLGTVYADRLHDHAAATRTWRRVLDLSPGNPKATRVLRDAYLSSGRVEAIMAEVLQPGWKPT